MRKRPDVFEWVSKAEQDYQTAEVMARRRKSPVPDIVGFHAQQCIERYLKAALVLRRTELPKTHDIIDLLEIVVAQDPLVDVLREDLRVLNPFSVLFRYPGESAAPEEASLALQAMRSARTFIRKQFVL